MARGVTKLRVAVVVVAVGPIFTITIFAIFRQQNIITLSTVVMLIIVIIFGIIGIRGCFFILER